MVPSTAKVVVVGGGVMGTGVAYHLAHEGWTDVVLLEKGELTSGSTWHAAGQITHSTSSYSLGKCVGYNIDLYNGKLEAETGQSVTWHGCGSFRLAYTEDEMDWLRHTISVGRSLGFPMELVSPDFIAQMHPFYNLDGVIGALYTPEDGYADPAGVGFGLAAGARQLGAKIVRNTMTTDIKRQPSGEWKVSWKAKSGEQGEILCEHVVNAGGTYARQMGEWSNLMVPCTSMTHHYLVTDTVPEFLELDKELPVICDDRMVSGYIRMEQKSGLIGIYEKANANTVWEEHCPWEAENELFEADYDRIMPWLENSMERMPILAELGIKREVHGAISHPPDGNPLVGPAANTDGNNAQNYWLAAGCQIGIGWGPGLTRELARWMVHGAADISMRDYDPRRFGRYADNSESGKHYQITKAKEDYLLRHEIPFPHFNRLDGRPVKPSALFDRLKGQGAVHEEVFGWERPRWFARDGVAEQRDYYSFKRTPVHDVVSAEVKAVRDAAGIMDISAFSKIEISGPSAASIMDRLAPNKLPSEPGRIMLTHLCNDSGRIELEATVVRLADDRFYLVCAAFFEQRLIDHLTRNIVDDEQAVVTNRSQEWGALTLNGPRSRDILGPNTPASLGNDDFKWMRAQHIEIAGQSAWVFRMSYAGELGYEIHAPMSSLLAIYDALWTTGEPMGLTNYGSFAMNAMRMEKMFMGAGELTNECFLPEVNVMRFVNMDKEFKGKAATQQAIDAGKRFSCAYLEIDTDGVVDGHGGEAVLVDGNTVGSTSSVAYGPTSEKVLAFAFIKPEHHEIGKEVEVVIAGEPRPARILGEPVYDPANSKPRDK